MTGIASGLFLRGRGWEHVHYGSGLMRAFISSRISGIAQALTREAEPERNRGHPGGP